MKFGKLRVGADWMHQRQHLSEEIFFKALECSSVQIPCIYMTP